MPLALGRPEPPQPLLRPFLLAAELGPVVMADDPCEAALGSVDPTGARKYYRARYYDSSAGRFISADPAASRNLYAYVGGRPVSYTDPTGMVSYNVTRRYYHDGGHHFDATGLQVAHDCKESQSCKGVWELTFEIKGEIGIQVVSVKWWKRSEATIRPFHSYATFLPT